MLLRPLHLDDLQAAEELERSAPAALPAAGPTPLRTPSARPDPERQQWVARQRHLLGTDPGGCWAAVDEGGLLVGVVTSLRREGLWGVSCFAVRPGAQAAGAGRALLERAGAHGAAALRGLVCATEDWTALRLYRASGHRLHPAMTLSGRVDRSALQAVRHVRPGGPADTAAADAVDWLVRGAPRGPDHRVLLDQCDLLLADTATGRGYAYVAGGRRLRTLAATDVATARELLWAVLAAVPQDTDVAVDHVTGEQDWAVSVALRAGLAVRPRGFVCVRGMKPPVPYVPSGAFL